MVQRDLSTNQYTWQTNHAYDGLSRKKRTLEYVWSNGAWALDPSATNDFRYVHDGREVIQERIAGNVITVNYTRGLDYGGGINGLLSRTVKGSPDAHYFYHFDGMGNVVQLTDSTQATVADYRYSAFGVL